MCVTCSNACNVPHKQQHSVAMQIALTDNVLWMQMNEPALLNTCHSVQVSRILKWRVARSYQADVLLKVSQHSGPSQVLQNSCLESTGLTQFLTSGVIIIFAEVLFSDMYSQPPPTSIGCQCLDC